MFGNIPKILLVEVSAGEDFVFVEFDEEVSVSEKKFGLRWHFFAP